MKLKSGAWILALLMLLPCCGKKEEEPQQFTSEQGQRVGRHSKEAQTEHTDEISEERWNLHKDSHGFQIKIPEGSKIETQKNGSIKISSPDNMQARIWPFFIPGQQNANDQFAQGLLQTLSRNLFPNASWNNPQKVSASVSRIAGTETSNRIVAILSVVPSNRGVSGILYASVAPEQKYTSAQQTFAKMFESFQLSGAPIDTTQKQEPQIQWVRWQDPREQAFSLEVPAGWKTEGGLFRVSPIDVRAALQTISPDGQIRINAGDANIPIFSEPTPQGVALGFSEGTWYTPGPGGTMLVRRYFTGLGFLMDYLSNTIAQQCGGLQITQQRDRQDLVQNINAVYAQYNTGLTFTLNAGEATFQCEQGQREGYYLAATKRTEASGVGVWNVEYLYGFIASSNQAGRANNILGHMVDSSRLNPDWVRMQQGITANVSAIAARTSQEISQIISNSYWQQQQTYDELSRRRSNATLGVQDVVDPATGQEYKVESGSNYYWVDQRGTIVGTDIDARPSLDFRELTQLP